MSRANQAMQKPARVLMYAAYFDPEYSGAALQALTLARELRARGHHIEFVTNRWPGLPASGEVEGFPVWRLEPGRLRKHRELRLWFNLIRWVWHHRRDFDILHSHGAYYTHAFIGPLGRVAGLRTVTKASLAKDDLLDLDRPLIGWLHRLMLSHFDACVAISAELADEFRAGGIKQNKIHHIPNGVDTARFFPVKDEVRDQLRISLGLPINRPIALYVGVLDERKNIEWLAQQWIENKAWNTRALLVAVGPQSREDKKGLIHGRLARLSQLAPEHFLLRTHTSEILHYFQCSDVLILPSIKEGLPNVVLEAMACGIPCIAARVSGNRELVIDDVTGYTYEHGDVTALADALRLCLGPQGRVLGAEARKQAESLYSIKAVADRYEALYCKLLGNRAHSIPSDTRTCSKFLVLTELFLPTKGGTAVWAAEVYKRLGGKDVHIVTADVPGAFDYDSASVNTIHRLDLRRIPWLRPESLLMYWRFLLKSISLALITRFDAIHALRALPEGLIAWLVARTTFRPVVVYAHGEELTTWGSGYKFKTMRFVLRHVDSVIANSEFTRSELLRLGVAKDKITLIHPGVDTEHFRSGLPCQDLKDSIGLKPEEKLILSVGRLQRRKGFDMVIQSLPLLLAQGLSVRYALIGLGEDWNYLHDLAKMHGVSDRVHFLGHVPAEDLPRWYNACHLFVMPNREIAGDTEGFGMVFIEAAACGKPSIAGRAGGTGSAVIDGVTGLRVDGSNIDSVINALYSLLNDEGMLKRLGTNAQQRAMKLFSWDRVASQTREMSDRLKSVLSG